MKANDILAAARAQIGTPFHHQGRVPGRALDCAGLVIHVAQTLGIAHSDVAAYGRRPASSLLENTLDSQPELVLVTGKPQPGDILLMRFSGEPQHLAIYTGENIIHSYLSVGQVVEHRYSDLWKMRTVRVYRFAGIES